MSQDGIPDAPARPDAAPDGAAPPADSAPAGVLENDKIEAVPADGEPDGGAPEPEHVEKFDVMYSCLRCGTPVSAIELDRLPEIKCICGFRVFTKMRPPVAKTVNAI